MARLQTDRRPGRARIRPVANPVDTFVTGPNPKSAALGQLAESLREIAPSLAQFSDVQARRKAEGDKAAGEQQAREYFESGKSARQAIKDGLIAPHQSEWFQLGAREQLGRLTAGRLSTDFQNAVENDPKLQESTSVKDFDTFLSQYRQKWIDENVGDENRDTYFERGFGSMADAYTEDARRQFVAQAGARLEKQVGENVYQEAFTMLQHEIKQNTQPQAIAEALNLLNDRAIAIGMSPRAVNIATVKALGDVIETDGNLQLFDILKTVRAGSGNLFSTQAAQQVLEDVTDKVSVNKQRQHVADREATRDAREEAVRATVNDIASRMIANPGTAREWTAQIAQLAKIDAGAAESLVRFQATASGAKWDSDQEAVNHALASIYSERPGSAEYVTSRRLVTLLNSQAINAQDFQFLNSQVNQRDDNARQAANAGGKSDKSPFTDPQFRDALSTLRSLYVSEYEYDATKSARAATASADFIQRYLLWSEGEGKGAGYEAKNKHLVWLRDEIARKYQDKTLQRDQDKIPKADLDAATGHIEQQQAWRTKRYASPQLLNRIAAEWNGRDGLSPATIRLFRQYKIHPTEVADFIAAQQALTTRAPH